MLPQCTSDLESCRGLLLAKAHCKLFRSKDQIVRPLQRVDACSLVRSPISVSSVQIASVNGGSEFVLKI